MIPPLSSLVLAVAAVLLFVLASVKVRNVSIAVSERARVEALEAELAEAKRDAGEAGPLRAAVAEIRALFEILAQQSKERAQAGVALTSAEQALEKAVKAVRPTGKDKKAKKAAELKIKKLRDDGAREIAVLRDRAKQIEKAMQKTSDSLNGRVKAMAFAAPGAPTSATKAEPAAIASAPQTVDEEKAPEAASAAKAAGEAKAPAPAAKVAGEAKAPGVKRAPAAKAKVAPRAASAQEGKE